MTLGFASPAPLPHERAPDLVCFSHLRWNFVYQRPQHLLSRAAKDRRVFYIEEPVWEEGPNRLQLRVDPAGVHVVTPSLPPGLSEAAAEAIQKQLVDELLSGYAIEDFVLWYYTPMALGFTRHLRPRATVYDVMDELSLFRFAPRSLLEREEELYSKADVVFTGGPSLHEAKMHRHPNVHLFPSSVDVEHFAAARTALGDPEDQAEIAQPRLGFFGVIDERMDLDLLEQIAAARPDWQVVLIGPVVKIELEELPRRSNLHYLGGKKYTDLPAYAAGWDVALMPWARNDATRFISPTKTPEYLAAGLPVVSTPIRDVVRPYGEAGLVRIASTPQEFIEEVEAAISEDPTARAGWQRRVDAHLESASWSRTWDSMRDAIASAIPASEPGASADHVSAHGGKWRNRELRHV